MKKLAFALALCLIAGCLSSGLGELAASGCHALYIDINGDVWAWGSNHRGESVPDSSDAFCATPRIVFEGASGVACGRQFSLALDAEGTLWLWGDNTDGKLENGSGTITAPARLLDDVQMADACEECFAALTNGGRLLYWNGSEYIELAGNVTDLACGAEFVLYTDEKRDAYIYGSADYLPEGADAGQAHLLMANCARVFASGQTGMLTDEAGTLYVMGASGKEGRLGINTTAWLTKPTPNGVSGVKAGVPGVSLSGAISEDGALFVWGTLYSLFSVFTESGAYDISMVTDELIVYGKTPISLYENVLDAAIGDAFVVIELSDHSLLSWGSNEWGQAGDGFHTEFVLTVDEDEGDSEIEIIANRQRIFPSVPEIKAK